MANPFKLGDRVQGADWRKTMRRARGEVVRVPDDHSFTSTSARLVGANMRLRPTSS